MPSPLARSSSLKRRSLLLHHYGVLSRRDPPDTKSWCSSLLPYPSLGKCAKQTQGGWRTGRLRVFQPWETWALFESWSERAQILYAKALPPPPPGGIFALSPRCSQAQPLGVGLPLVLINMIRHPREAAPWLAGAGSLVLEDGPVPVQQD